MNVIIFVVNYKHESVTEFFFFKKKEGEGHMSAGIEDHTPLQLLVQNYGSLTFF